MNLRYEILKACAANPGAPMVEICDSIKHDRQKTTWSVRDCAKAGLLSMRRDDVTGQPGYTLTAEGKQRLAEGPGSKQGGNMKKADSDSEGGEADVKAQSAEIPPPVPPQIPPAPDAPDVPDVPDVPDDVEHDDAMPPADASLLALANRELADRLARVAHVLRGSGLEGLKDLDDGADLQTAAAALTGAYQMALANLQARGEQFLEMQDALNKRDDELAKVRDLLLPHVYIVRAAHAPNAIDCAKLIAERIAVVSHSDSLRLDTIARASETLAEVVDGGDTDPDELDLLELADLVAQNLHDLRAQIETLQREAMRGTSLISGQDRYTAAGYLVRASKRKPRTLLDKDKARDAALSSIRAGAQRAEVFALVPIGHARRGAEWMPS